MSYSLPALQDASIRSTGSSRLPLLHPKTISEKESKCGWCGGLMCTFILTALLQTFLCAIIIWYVGHRALQVTVGQLTDQLRLAVLDDSLQRVNYEFTTVLRAAHQLRFMTATRFPDFSTRLRVDDQPGYLSDLTKLNDLYPQIERLGVSNTHSCSMFLTSPATYKGHAITSIEGLQYVFLAQPFYGKHELYAYRSTPIHPTSEFSLPFSVQGEIYDDDSPDVIARYLGPVRASYPWLIEEQPIWKMAIALPATQPAGWIGQIHLLPMPGRPATRGFTVVSIARAQTNVTGATDGGNKDNQTSGNIDFVASITLSRFAFSQFLAQLPFGPNGKGYLIRFPTGACVASSVPALAEQLSASAIGIDLATSDDPFLTILYPILVEQGLLTPPLTKHGNHSVFASGSAPFLPNGTVYQRKFHTQGDDWQMQARMADQELSGAPYFVVLVTRDFDFNGRLRSNVLTTIWTTILVVLAAILVSSIVTGCVKAPLLRIVKFLERANNVVAMPCDGKQRATLATLCRDWSQVLRNDTTSQFTLRGLTGADSDQAACRHSVPDDIASPLVELSRAQLPSGKCQPGSCLNAGRWLREIDLMYRSFGAMLFSLASYDELESINQAKRQFIRYIFHEVRVPFNAIVLGIEQMEMDLALHSRLDSDCEAALAPCTETMAIVHEQGEVVSRILNDVLSIQKIEDGALTLDFSAFDLEKMVRVALHAFRVPCREKRLHLHLRCPNLDQLITSHRARIPLLQAYPNVHLGTIPSPEAHDLAGAWRAHIEADPYRLRQALANFLSNAIKFSKTGGTITVVLEYNHFTPAPLASTAACTSSNGGLPHADDSDASRALLASPVQELPSPAPLALNDLDAHGKCLSTVELVIRVRDTGVGLAPEACARMFQQYAQIAANRNQAGGGTGLGLSITKSIIELHGGTISVSSRENEGSEFVISIPYIRILLAHTDETSLSGSGAALHELSSTIVQTSLVCHTPNLPLSQPSSGHLRTRRIDPEGGPADTDPLPPSRSFPVANQPRLASLTAPPLAMSESGPKALRTLAASAVDQLGPTLDATHAEAQDPSSVPTVGPPSSPTSPLLAPTVVPSPSSAAVTFPSTSPPLFDSASSWHVRSHPLPGSLSTSPNTGTSIEAEAVGELPVSSQYLTNRWAHRLSSSFFASATRSSTRNSSWGDEPSMFADSPHFASFTSAIDSPATRRGSSSHLETAPISTLTPLEQTRRSSISLISDPMSGLTAQPTLHPPLPRTEDLSILADAAKAVPTSAPSLVHRPSRSSGSYSRAARSQRGSGIRPGARVLVVEDSLPNRKLLLSILTHLGVLAVGAENGKECVDLFPDDPSTAVDPPFDAVIMDGNMPVMNGVEATRILRSRGVTIPVIAVTGNALAEDVANFLRAGATSVLTKPINRTQLGAALVAQLPPIVIDPSTKTLA